MSGQVVRHALSPCASVRQFKLGAMPCARASVGDINASERALAIFRVFMRPLSSLAEPSAFRRPHAATWDATRQLEVFSRRREAVLKIKTVSCLPMAHLEDVKNFACMELNQRFRWLGYRRAHLIAYAVGDSRLQLRRARRG